MYVSAGAVILIIAASMFIGVILGRIDGESTAIEKRDSKKYR